jgi:hypothetical protein
MKKLCLFLILGWVANAQAAQYDCNYVGSDVKNTIKVDIDLKTLFVQADGPDYSIAGYAFKQVSKKAGRTFLILPAGFSIPSITIELAEDGGIQGYDSAMDRLDCKASGTPAPLRKRDPRAVK